MDMVENFWLKEVISQSFLGQQWAGDKEKPESWEGGKGNESC